MEHAVKMGSVSVKYIPSVIKIGSGIQNLRGGGIQRHRLHGGLLSLVSFVQNKESKLKIKNNRI
jgi:hypothetical protein